MRAPIDGRVAGRRAGSPASIQSLEPRLMFAGNLVLGTPDYVFPSGQKIGPGDFAYQHYGYVASGSTDLSERRFLIANRGDAPTIFRGMTVPAGFRVAFNGAYKVGTTFRVGFEGPDPFAYYYSLRISLDPSMPGYHKGDLVIKSDASTFTMEIDGTVGPPAAAKRDNLGAIGSVTRNDLFTYQDYAHPFNDPTVPDMTVGGAISSPSFRLYRFTLPEAGDVALALDHPAVAGHALQATVYRDGGKLGTLDPADAASPLRSVANHAAATTRLAAGSYLLRVQASDTGPDSFATGYTLSLKALAPHLQVRAAGKAAAIVAGDATPSPLDGTDLGAVTVGGTLSRQLTLTNSGNQALTLRAPVLSNNHGFTLGSLPTTLAAGASATLTLSLADTSAAGAFAAHVGIPADDPKLPAGVFNFDVRATVAPNLASDHAPPTATLTVAPRVTAAAKYYRFTVRYTDANGVDPTTLDKYDLTVTGPRGVTLTGLRLISATPSVGGKVVDAVYRADAPGNSWDPADNGLYVVSLRKDQVKDLAGNAMAALPTAHPAGGDGRFRVKVPAPR